MKEEEFDRLMEGVKQGAEYLKGARKGYRIYEVTVPVPDVKNIRKKLKASQSEFAQMLGISVRTVQNWEQKHRVPEGPARVLLEVVAAYPEQVREVSRRVAKRKITGSGKARKAGASV
jgi:putative transcriptional regulator